MTTKTDYDIERRAAAEADQIRAFLTTHGLSSVSLRSLFDGLHQGADALHNATIDAAQFRVACAAGCGYCCHTLVVATAPEAFYIHRRLREDPEGQALIASALETDRKARGKTGAQRYANRIACGFLDPDSKMCRIHKYRGLTCRAMHSESVVSCRSAYEKRDPYKPTQSLKAFFVTNRVFFKALTRALAGRDMRQLDLMAAMAVIEQTPDAFALWAKGDESVFAPAVAPVDGAPKVV